MAVIRVKRSLAQTIVIYVFLLYALCMSYVYLFYKCLHVCLYVIVYVSDRDPVDVPFHLVIKLPVKSAQRGFHL